MSSCFMPPGCHEAHIGIADRHPLFRSALCELIKGQLPGIPLCEFGTVDALSVELETSHLPSVLMVDMQMPGLGGLSGLLQLANRHPATRIIAVCDDLPDEPQQLLMHGAIAGISKAAAADQFIEAIRTVLQGQCWLPAKKLEHPFCVLQSRTGLEERFARLSPRRQLIVNMVADGRLNKQIAHELGLCESTIKAHVSQIMKVLHVRNRTQIATTVSRLRNQSAPPLRPAALNIPMLLHGAHHPIEHHAL